MAKSKTKTKLFKLDFDYKVKKDLEFAFEHFSKFKKEEKTKQLLKYEYNPEPLIDKWKTVSVLKEKGPRSDVFQFGLDFAVSKKVKTALAKQLGDSVEFLPLKVVGEYYENADYDEVCKLKSSQEEIYVIHPTSKVKMAFGTKSEDFVGVRDYIKFAFRPDDLAELVLFRPPHSGPFQTLVSQAFRDVVKRKNIKGFTFKKIDWTESYELATKKRGSRVKLHTAAKTKGTKKASVPKSNQRQPAIAARKFVRSTYSTMIKGLWEIHEINWNWVCEASIGLCTDKPKKPKISKPISNSLLARIKKMTELPREFEQVLTKFSAKVDLGWGMIEADEYPMPKEIEACTFGVGPLWDARAIPELAKLAADHKNSQWRAFREGLEQRLPFIELLSGDLVAFCLRKGNKNCPVVYLSHDNDDRVHNRQIGINFVDFLVNWTNVGCIELDLANWEPFYNKQKNKIDGFCRAAMRWRKYMENGC